VIDKITTTTKVIFVASTFTILLALWSFLIEPNLLTINTQNKANWPIKPLKIVFFSDLHAGSPHINKSYIQKLVEKINKSNPDIILIGGDLVINGVIGGRFMDIDSVAVILEKLNAPLGKFVVLGNHDWWNDGKKIRRVLSKKGFNILENESFLIEMDPKNKFWLVGIGDHYTNHSDPKLALNQTNDLWPKIIFMHDPASLFEIKSKFFLSLAGHMHGGQVFIPGIGALITPGDAPKEWAKGWIDFEFGSLYVSQGIGTSILPLRFNAPPEFIILNLFK
jgi:uncharacterized protein